MLAAGSGLHGRVMLAFNMLLLTWMWGRCELGRWFEQQTHVNAGETFSVSMQGVIWPSPDSRTWDFTQDLRAQDALIALLAGLLSKGKQRGKMGCLGACPGLPGSRICSAGGFQPLPWMQTGCQSPALRCL